MHIIKTTKDLGEVIRATRKAQKLTQPELAAVSNVGVRFLVDLEKGKETIHLGKTLHILRMLGITLAIEEEG